MKIHSAISFVILWQMTSLVLSRPDANKPLILTDLIEQGKIEEARNLAEVRFKTSQAPKLLSYSGYFNVDKTYDSNIFFWFFPSEYSLNDPVIMWLQGGPGWSSLNGLFMENGPFISSSNGSIELRDTYWSKNHSVLYVDQPVGTGFSYTSQGGYVQNQTILGVYLYNVLIQFFQLFPQLQSNTFFIAGESYAGKYIPSIGNVISKRNINAKIKINLQGLMIGNGYVDPENQIIYSDYLYQLGLVDLNEKQLIKKYEDEIINYIKNNNFLAAGNALDSLVTGYTQKPLILNITGLTSVYNFLLLHEVNQTWTKFVTNKEIRKLIHVGNVKFGEMKQTVEKNLWLDIAKSEATILSRLLDHYRVLLYSGQDDIIIAYPTTVNFLKRLNFTASQEYKHAKRRIWRVENEIAGYRKTAGNLTEVLVRNAGHMVPADQPRWSYNLIYNFIRKAD
ncbi:venom serine carboxypeptidase-like [Sitophilus oryzae]|uniref:Carboxypeptidase n=1 Tax=Sitophilus oryzae TaxID=7048 RepID=A0A6J2X169_SITOR|nr:venom serine carboxypeptidase-like [Sitophilus oryzae]XP_030744977.1 venom serine carboxypeptidase-like [Sitophilus oryzae]